MFEIHFAFTAAADVPRAPRRLAEASEETRACGSSSHRGAQNPAAMSCQNANLELLPGRQQREDGRLGRALRRAWAHEYGQGLMPVEWKIAVGVPASKIQ